MSVTAARARGAFVIIAALAWLVAAPAVLADAELTATFPEAGGTLDTPPRTIAARFSQDIGSDSSIELVGPDGQTVATGGVDPTDSRRLIIQLDTVLPAGTYEVRWVAFSADGHLVNDTFGFTVLAPEPTATPEGSIAEPSPTALASPTAEPTEIPLPSPSASPGPAPTSGSDLLIPIVAAVVLVGGLGLFLLRGRR
jgi:methionine-rich copper-binding protein CopC